jgi:hypothetical protein
LRNDVMKILIIEDKIFHDTIIRIYRRIRTGEVTSVRVWWTS